MPVAWYPSRWWNWCLLEDEEKRNRTNREVVKVIARGENAFSARR